MKQLLETLAKALSHSSSKHSKSVVCIWRS